MAGQNQRGVSFCESGEGQATERHESRSGALAVFSPTSPASVPAVNIVCLLNLASTAEAERLLRSCQEQLDAAKREVVMFKRTANHAPAKPQHVSQSHISQPLLNSYIGAAIRCV